MYIIGVTYIIKEGHDDEAAALLADAAAAFRTHPGTLLFVVNRAVDDPCHFFLYEQYSDEDARNAHRESAEFKEIIAGKVWPLLESRTPITYTLVE